MIKSIYSIICNFEDLYDLSNNIKKYKLVKYYFKMETLVK